MKKSKYGNIKTRSSDGKLFDSKKEARRYSELCLLERAGEISKLRCQVVYILIPTQKGERECKYIADFVYREKGEETDTVEDCKGKRTREYIIKRKLMLWVYGIKIKET